MNNEEEKQDYKKRIKRHTKKVWLPPENIVLNNVKTNSWFTIKTHNNGDNKRCKLKKPIQAKNIIKRCFKVELFPNLYEKNILDVWFNACTIMYNVALKYIKEYYRKTGKTDLTFEYIRTYCLKKKRDDIQKWSKDIPIFTHILDRAIKLASSNYQSALTNLARRHIKHFRIKYWRYNRNKRLIDIEPQYFNRGVYEPGFLSRIHARYDGGFFDLSWINSHYNKTCRLIHNREEDKYLLYVTTNVIATNLPKESNMISLDPGSRTFLTGISDNGVVKISPNQSKIFQLLRKTDRYNSKSIPMKIKKKNEERCNRKIKFMVEDLHWKSIKYLTDKHENILIGDMSVKSIVSNENRIQIPKISKRILLRLSFYKFKERLKHKCTLNSVAFEEVNERYTSKMCSCCGYVKEDLGSDKIYSCNECKVVMDRDINGARGIFIKAQ